MATTTLADHPYIMNTVWLCFGLLVGFILGSLWGRWKSLRETPDLSDDEITLVNADRHRRRRESGRRQLHDQKADTSQDRIFA